MGLLGLSLIVASVVYVIIRPPAWFWTWRGFRGFIADGKSTSPSQRNEGATKESQDGPPRIRKEGAAAATSASMQLNDRIAMPPPPPPPTIIPPTIAEPEDDEDSPTTPKATATVSVQPVPTFSLSSDSSTSTATSMMPPPPPPSLSLNPPSPSPSAGRIPSLAQFPAPNSIQRARGPAPNRNPTSLSSGLAPPPTLSSKPEKPSRKVILTPGHSPLDWARISGPNADLRGLPSSTPYLRVTPSMLKVQTGRKGKDAWMALSGKVYNITPYAKFHPGGVPELMRGRPGTAPNCLVRFIPGSTTRLCWRLA
ncbi:Cytochrome b5 reductase 4 [Cladobotryum mycophilum]|uniref:Cytochrome b5 reductase 4 n=1 Tax=Cladobotryum mycophilum TaxID=491253 RepID=A0ABR0SK50_9HYPO